MYCIDTELGPRLLDLLLISRSSVTVDHPCCYPSLEVLAKEMGISMSEINLAGFQIVQCASIMLMGLGKWRLQEWIRGFWQWSSKITNFAGCWVWGIIWQCCYYPLTYIIVFLLNLLSLIARVIIYSTG